MLSAWIPKLYVYFSIRRAIIAVPVKSNDFRQTISAVLYGTVRYSTARYSSIILYGSTGTYHVCRSIRIFIQPVLVQVLKPSKIPSQLIINTVTHTARGNATQAKTQGRQKQKQPGGGLGYNTNVSGILSVLYVRSCVLSDMHSDLAAHSVL